MSARERGLLRLFQLEGRFSDDELERMKAELDIGNEDHELVLPELNPNGLVLSGGIYDWNDFSVLGNEINPNPCVELASLDDLLDMDKQRIEDGLKTKIRLGQLTRPSASGGDSIVIVPTTVEEKFVHEKKRREDGDNEEMGGSGDGEEGDVLGQVPKDSGDGDDGGGSGDGEGPGQGEGSDHDMTSSAYELGEILTGKFKLPNIKPTRKKGRVVEIKYEMDDKHRRFGHFLDKKATMRRVVATNIGLGRVKDPSKIDTSNFIVSPSDLVYRILSKNKVYESQALVFFVRDYSGSMGGEPTKMVVSQHLMIYSWLYYQYNRQVESRFVVHDTEAKTVPNFYKYYNLQVSGGTEVYRAFELVNRIVEQEGLADDYNVYVFYGTDGDDWNSEGKKMVSEMEKMMRYVSRIGVTIASHSYHREGNKTQVEKNIIRSGLLEKYPELLRMDVLPSGSNEDRLIEGIKNLISE